MTEFLDGFTKGYRAILRHRPELLGAASPLHAFASVTNRVIIRDTQLYSDTLEWSLLADHLTSGASHDVALERISFLSPQVEEFLDLAVFCGEEKRRLWHLDIPAFYGMPSTNRARTPDGPSRPRPARM